MTAPSSQNCTIALDKTLADILCRFSCKCGKRYRCKCCVHIQFENLPYTVIIRINDSTVINNPPISVTAHKGILSKNPQSSMVVTISAGKVVCSGVPNPAAFIMVEIVPCTILNSASISSIPYVITPFANANEQRV